MELYSLNGLIEILNISGEQAELYDKCNWFITCLLKRTTLNDKRKEKPNNYFTNISSNVLKEYLGTRDYKDVIELLIEKDIINKNDTYSKGKFSKSYAFTEKAIKMDKVEVVVQSKSFTKRLSDISEKEYQETIKDPLLKRVLDNTAKLIIVEKEDYYKSELSNLTDEEMENEIDPDERLKERWHQYNRYSSFYDEFKSLNEVIETKELIKCKIYQKPIIAKSGRIYHTVSSIPRLIRQSMRVFGGHYLWEVDMSAAQPTLIMLEWLKITYKSKEATLVKSLILKGEIYNYIKQNTNYFKKLEYAKLKKEILQGLYEEHISSERNKTLKTLFPDLMNWVNTIKKEKGYKTISHIGQKLEADIFVEVYKNLPNDMFCLIIHDSILCLEQDTKTIKKVLIEKTREIFLILNDENLDKLFKVSLVSIKDEDLLQVKNERLLREFIEKKTDEVVLRGRNFD
tara:strand:- start:242 stop:1612 length:1371 start_codon:yes stop_codon:yes gene_type:complete